MADAPNASPGRPRRTQFWGAHPDDDHLVLEVMAGRKTATVSPEEENALPSGEFDDGDMRVGEEVEVYDLRGKLRCRIRVTEVYPLTFGEIPEKLWRGEGCSSAEEFREEHRRAWPDKRLDDAFRLVATHFRLEGPPP